MQKLEILKHWIVDYLYAIRGYGHMFLYREPAHYRGYVAKGKAPVILIPGIAGKWQSLKYFGDHLSRLGHPVYIPRLRGFNMGEIKEGAKVIRELIDENDLKNVILVGHSKGGLIGKYILAHHNADSRVDKLIAIATPFAGSRIAAAAPFRAYAELHPASSAIKQLREHENVNSRIISLYGTFDNHIWPQGSAILPGAKNIEVPVNGHHKILFDKNVLKIVDKEAEDSS
jgi:pimeloyl-ACP methyl ester carboxylesterase